MPPRLHSSFAVPLELKADLSRLVNKFDRISATLMSLTRPHDLWLKGNKKEKLSKTEFCAWSQLLRSLKLQLNRRKNNHEGNKASNHTTLHYNSSCVVTVWWWPSFYSTRFSISMFQQRIKHILPLLDFWPSPHSQGFGGRISPQPPAHTVRMHNQSNGRQIRICFALQVPEPERKCNAVACSEWTYWGTTNTFYYEYDQYAHFCHTHSWQNFTGCTAQK